MANTTLGAFSQNQRNQEDQHDLLAELASNETLLPPTQPTSPSHSTRIVSSRTTQPTNGNGNGNGATPAGSPGNPFEHSRN
jgi:hypothetical protein